MPIVLNVSAACGKILPDGCYGFEEEIFAKTNVWDCVFGHLSARVIDKAYTDLDAARAIVAAYMPAGTTVTSFTQPNAFVPAGVIGTISDTVVLWLTGTTDFQQLAAQALYFGLGPEDQGLYSASILYEQAALAVADLLNARGLGTAGRIVLCGHSFGGAVCMVLAARMMTADPNRLVEILTLGAPQPGDERLQHLIELLAQRHYANERDPIPYLPPTDAVIGLFVPVLGALLLLQWARFARPPQTKQITTQGEFRDVRSDDLPADFLNVAAVAIAAGADLPAFKDHSTTWYIYYLCLACKCVSRPCPRPDAGELGFDIILEGMHWQRSGVDTVENFASNLAYEALGDIWTFREGPHARVTIEPHYDLFGNYDAFTVTYEIESPSPTDVTFAWHFTAEEMLMGVDTTTAPEFFPVNPGDHFISMGRLVIPSAFLFPPIDGMGGDGFDEIYDGNPP